MKKIPYQGVIPIVDNGEIVSEQDAIRRVKRSMQLKTSNVVTRSWLFDVLNCVNKTEAAEFSSRDTYAYENALYQKHPGNNNIRPKIRQQLQLLRDRGYIEFTARGKYRKL